MSEDNYRYWINPNNGEIMRGELYCLADLGYDTSDQWRWYWEGDGIAAFTIYWRGQPELNVLGGDTDDVNRAMNAWYQARQHGDVVKHGKDAMDRLAFRLTGQWDARFICVPLERAYDLYALSWDGDPDGSWAKEIEAVNYGEIYRVHTWVHTVDKDGEPVWIEDDDECEEWYGEESAREVFEKNWPLDVFPAELLVETMPLSDGGSFDGRLNKIA